MTNKFFKAPFTELQAISDYPGYFAGFDGSIWSYKKINYLSENYRWRKLRPQKSTNGYYQYNICQNGKQKTVTGHQLVMKAFFKPIPGMEVNHVNGIKTDNRPSNLEYCTKSENQLHALKLGLSKVNLTDTTRNLGRAANLAKARSVDMLLNGKVIKTFKHTREAAEELDINASSIRACLSGKMKTFKKYEWRYTDGKPAKKYKERKI